MIEKIVQTAKQAVKAIVLRLKARVCSALEAVATVCMAGAPARMAFFPKGVRRQTYEAFQACNLIWIMILSKVQQNKWVAIKYQGAYQLMPSF